MRSISTKSVTALLIFVVILIALTVWSEQDQQHESPITPPVQDSSVQRPGTDLSSLVVTVEAPADLLMIDSQGRRSGFDPNTGAVIEEIPASGYYTEGPLMGANVPGIRILDVSTPAAGKYTLLVIAHEQQTLEITFYRYDREAQPTITSDTRQVAPGSPVTYRIEYDPEPGSPFNVEMPPKD